MPIGDSITDDCSLNGAWRLYLQPLLQTSGYPFMFVGRQASFPVLPSFASVNHEGHCGAVIGPPGVFAVHGYNTSDDYLLKIVADALATNAQPDLILCMAGVNDIGRGRDPYQVVHRDLAALLDLMFSNAPNVHIILAKITSLQDAVLPDLNYGAYATNVPVFNAELQSLVNARRGLEEQVYLADMFSAVDYGTMFLPDHVHPNSSGQRAIANEWMARINSITVRTNQFVSTLIHGRDKRKPTGCDSVRNG